MEDQVLHVDKEQEALSGVDLARKLHNKERRLSARLEEAQEAEARAQDHFQRAEARLQRRRTRLERIQGKLLLVQKQLADSHIHDQQPAQIDSALVMPSTAESTAEVASEEVAPVLVEQDIEGAQASNALANGTRAEPVPVQAEQDIEAAHEPEGSSPAVAEHISSETVEPVAVTPSEDIRTVSPTLEAEIPSSSQTETAPILADLQQVLAASNGEHEWGHLAPQQEISSPASLMPAPVETTLKSEGSSLSSIEPDVPTTIEQEPVASVGSTAVEPEVDATPEVDTSSDSSVEREPTKPLRLEQESQTVAGLPSPDVQAAKEAWVAAESAVQHARNTAHGIAASISFLSQTNGFSEKFMAELVYKQAEANKALVKAQEASRSAYERFVEAQEHAEHAASQPVDVPMGVSEDHTREKQENGVLPEAGVTMSDQTVSMHAIRLYRAE